MPAIGIRPGQLLNDPRQASFIQSVGHYVSAARAQTRALAQRPVPWQGANVIDEAIKNVGLSPAEEARRVAQDQRAWQREGAQMLQREATERASHAGEVSLPLVGATINPAHLVEALATLKLPVGALGLGGKLLNEAIDLPGQTALAGAMTGEAAAKAIQGDTAPIKKLGSELF